MPAFSEVEAIKYFNLGRWVTNLDQLLETRTSYSGLRSALTGSRLAVGLYEKFSPVLLSRQLRKFGDYIYHSPNFFLPPFPGKSIATFHDMSVYRHPEYHRASQVALMEKEIPKALERADHIIAISEFTKQEIIDITGYPEDRISVVYNGVSEEFHPRPEDQLEPKLARYDLKPGRYFLSLATIEPRKNIGTILDAYLKLPNSIRKYYPLVIGGTPGWKSQAIHQRIQALTVRGQVRYLGYVPEQDLPILYAGATAKIFIPFYEGFGLPALEAMASGVPVIVSNASSLPEVFSGGGLCIDSLDVDGITANMEMLVKPSENINHYTGTGLAIANRLSWQQCAIETLNAYQS